MDTIVIEKRYTRAEPGSIKKVLALQGSPRKVGTTKTDILLQAFLQGCREQGAETETIYLRDKKINHCIGCFTCWSKTPGKCVSKDDVESILLQQTQADLTVYAFPLYHYGINSLMKKYIERTLPLIEPYLMVREDGETYHPMRDKSGKKRHVVVLGVCGFPEVSHFAAASANFHCLARAASLDHFGIIAEIYRPASEILNNPVFQIEIDRVLQATKEAGAQVVQKGTVDQEIVDAIARVELDLEEFRVMANSVWDHCIKEGKTLPELQKEMLERNRSA